MRGISRSALFKNHGLEKSRGALTASLPSGVDATFIPVISDVNVLLYNPKNLPGGAVTPEPILSPSLRSNLRAVAKNSITKPAAMVVFNVHHAPNVELFVSVVYSRYSNFPNEDVKEKNLIIKSNSAVMFSLNDLLPGVTYYVKTQARSLATGISSVWTPTYPIVINMPSAPNNGVVGGIYYINGHATSLNLNGTGEWEGVYYISGQATTLVEIDELGWSGVHEGLQYYNGIIADGYIDTKWWFNGLQTVQIFYIGGNGWYNNLFYQNFAPFTGGLDGNFYAAGHYRPNLDDDGYGLEEGLIYYQGVPHTGILGEIYYVNGLATTLNAAGTGTWNNQYYSGGAYVGDVGNPYDSGQTSGQGSRFSEGVTYG